MNDRIWMVMMLAGLFALPVFPYGIWTGLEAFVGLSVLMLAVIGMAAER